MKNIVLICAGGMSTSLLVNRMREAAEKENYPCHIEAFGLPSVHKVVPDADLVLLGPQVRFGLSKLRQQFPDKTIDIMEMNLYGSMNGEEIFKMAKRLLGDE